jgi:hypothetical protein
VYLGGDERSPFRLMRQSSLSPTFGRAFGTEVHIHAVWLFAFVFIRQGVETCQARRRLFGFTAMTS